MLDGVQRRRDLIELARICLEQARAAQTADVAAELGRMAREYRQRAAQLNADAFRPADEA
jgi:hypothetical protein